MKRRARVRLAMGGVVAVTALSLPWSVSVEAGTAATCPDVDGVAPNIWKGLGSDQPGATSSTNWNLPGNWTRGAVPRRLNPDGYACVSAGAPVVDDGGEPLFIYALHIGAAGDVFMGKGTKLLVYGDQEDQVSTIDPGGRLHVQGATFGGSGLMVNAGQMIWESLDTDGAATFRTRLCNSGSPDVPCAGDEEPTGPLGLLRIADTGRLDVTSQSPNQGVNLQDRYQIETRGLMVVAPTRYVAADHGTSLAIVPKSVGTGKGALVLQRNAGWKEGSNPLGLAGLASINNNGTLRKAAGTRGTVISATYTQGQAGLVVVADSGKLFLPDGSPHAAQVESRATYGSGTCVDPQNSACQPTTFASDKQNGRLEAPDNNQVAEVVVQELASGQIPNTAIGKAFRIHAENMPTGPGVYARIFLRYDSSILGGDNAASVRILRRPDTAAAYSLLPNCPASGNPSVAKGACVNRDPSDAEVDRSHDEAGDAVMVIHALDTSRWVARRSIGR